MIVHSGSLSIDIETSHGDDRSEGGDGAGFVEVYFESVSTSLECLFLSPTTFILIPQNWYTNHLIDGEVWNVQTFENCPVLRKSAPVFLIASSYLTVTLYIALPA